VLHCAFAWVRVLDRGATKRREQQGKQGLGKRVRLFVNPVPKGLTTSRPGLRASHGCKGITGPWQKAGIDPCQLPPESAATILIDANPNQFGQAHTHHYVADRRSANYPPAVSIGGTKLKEIDVPKRGTAPVPQEGGKEGVLTGGP
jgi:hypothetical protein